MPPEALVKNLYSVESDIFSIGVLFFELVVGTAPWEARTEKELIRKMSSIPFKIPSKVGLSLEVKNLLKTLCEVDPQKRMNKDQFMQLKLVTKKSEAEDIHIQ